MPARPHPALWAGFWGGGGAEAPWLGHSVPGTAPQPEALLASPLLALCSPARVPTCWVPPSWLTCRWLQHQFFHRPPPLPPPNPRVRAFVRCSQKPPERSGAGTCPDSAGPESCLKSRQRRRSEEAREGGLLTRCQQAGTARVGAAARRNAQPCHTQALGSTPREELRVGPVQRSAETTPHGPPEDAAWGMPPPGQVEPPRRGELTARATVPRARARVPRFRLGNAPP